MLDSFVILTGCQYCGQLCVLIHLIVILSAKRPIILHTRSYGSFQVCSASGLAKIIHRLFLASRTAPLPVIMLLRDALRWKVPPMSKLSRCYIISGSRLLTHSEIVQDSRSKIASTAAYQLIHHLWLRCPHTKLIHLLGTHACLTTSSGLRLLRWCSHVCLIL